MICLRSNVSLQYQQRCEQRHANGIIMASIRVTAIVSSLYKSKAKYQASNVDSRYLIYTIHSLIVLDQLV